MKKAMLMAALGALIVPALALAQAQKSVNVNEIVELELLTTSEAYDKIHNQGKTSVLLITGGTEARGPHNVLGGHTIMSRHRGVEIARRLGNALAGAGRAGRGRGYRCHPGDQNTGRLPDSRRGLQGAAACD